MLWNFNLFQSYSLSTCKSDWLRKQRKKIKSTQRIIEVRPKNGLRPRAPVFGEPFHYFFVLSTNWVWTRKFSWFLLSPSYTNLTTLSPDYTLLNPENFPWKFSLTFSLEEAKKTRRRLCFSFLKKKNPPRKYEEDDDMYLLESLLTCTNQIRFSSILLLISRGTISLRSCQYL